MNHISVQCSCILYFYISTKKYIFPRRCLLFLACVWSCSACVFWLVGVCVYSDNRADGISGGGEFSGVVAAALWRFRFGVILNYADPAAWWAVAFGLCRHLGRLRSAAAAAFVARSLLELVRLPFSPCVKVTPPLPWGRGGRGGWGTSLSDILPFTSFLLFFGR